jgi:hypothetical protein
MTWTALKNKASSYSIDAFVFIALVTFLPSCEDGHTDTLTHGRDL